MSEFRVGDFEYRARSMDAFSQLDVMAKLSPLLAAGASELIPFFLDMSKNGLTTADSSALTGILAALDPAAKALANMSGDDRRFIIGTCLSLCERQTSNGWTKIWNIDAGRAMFDDINNDVSVMLKITTCVLQGTFQRFFPEALSKLIGTTGL